MKAGDIFITCVDANLRITRLTMGTTGANLSGRSHGGTDQEHLIAFAKAVDLFILNTVDEYLADVTQTGTFVVQGEAFPIRSDFILSNRTEGVVSRSVEVWRSMILHAAVPDHIPLVARAKFHVVRKTAVVKRRFVSWAILARVQLWRHWMQLCGPFLQCRLVLILTVTSF